MRWRKVKERQVRAVTLQVAASEDFLQRSFFFFLLSCVIFLLLPEKEGGRKRGEKEEITSICETKTIQLGGRVSTHRQK